MRRRPLRLLSRLAALFLAGSLWPFFCGPDKVPIGGFCEKDGACEAGLVCRQNTCVKKPDANDCRPECRPDEICLGNKCVPVTPGSDKDGDGFTSETECDDLDPFTYPANPKTGAPGGFELCDGRDNDCDGQTDEGCYACEDGSVQPCGSDLGECSPGIQTCGGGIWGPCSDQGPSPEIADGLDNDCDGTIDDGLPCQGSSTEPCGNEIGECRIGTQTCKDGKRTPCIEGRSPIREQCNNRDDDCDGFTDDGFMLGLPCDGVGECEEGTIECATENTNHCSSDPGGSRDQSRPESCNGLDDDCDGLADENWEGGQPCTSNGACGPGVWECRSSTERRCSTEPGASQDRSVPELCDGLDNDCDGETDEDFAFGLPCEGLGPCGAGLTECAPSGKIHCSTEQGGSQDQSRPELCDGIDNDCDGGIDDDYFVGEVCDGAGICGVGKYECASSTSSRCSTEHGGSQDQSRSEVCDKLDNDCDGEIDDGDDLLLCSPLAPHVIAATCDHLMGTCLVSDSRSDCETGWWDFNRVWTDGCELMLDDGSDAPDDCTVSRSLGSLPDDGSGGRRVVRGNLVPAKDEDWYQVVGVDNFVNDEARDLCDNYHVFIRFNTQPAGVVFDLGLDACNNIGCTGESDFEFSTNGRWGDAGECPCRMANTPSYNVCTAQDHRFFIRIHRLPGYDVTPDPYVLEITNGPTAR